jgi:tRNA pseudouridine55 synthase
VIVGIILFTFWVLPMENLELGELIPVDKPLFWTSFDVVAHFRRAVKPLKIGHAGTLDPLASGLLILCTGKMTKRIEEIQHWPKTYTGYFYLGNETASFDRETPKLHATDAQLPNETAIQQAVLKLTGSIMQIPPGYSALKVDGQAAYRQAHKGEVRKLEARPADRA